MKTNLVMKTRWCTFLMCEVVIKLRTGLNQPATERKNVMLGPSSFQCLNNVLIFFSAWMI